VKRYLRFRIPHDRVGAALADFLAARFPYHSAAAWSDRVTDGQVHLNGRAATPDTRLALGDLVEYVAQDAPEPEVSFAVRVLHRDADLLVLDKPPNLPCHPGGRHFQHTLWAYLKMHEQVDCPEFVNRIDRETSGVVVVALTPVAARRCRAQFAGRQVQKRYLALVEGRFPAYLSACGHIVPAKQATPARSAAARGHRRGRRPSSGSSLCTAA
jgi:23S rRNA pseudouridine1911/1915/1917 synthase